MDGARLGAGLGLAVLLLGAGAALVVCLRRPAVETPRVLEERTEPAPLPSVRRPVGVPAEAPPAAGSAERVAEDSGPWSRLNNEAVAALEAGDLERALELLEQCVAAAGEVEVYRRNLAEVLARAATAERERERGCTSCLERLARALELAPDRADLARLLGRWRAEDELERDFWRESSVHFDLSYDGFRTELLHNSHRLLEVLEDAYIDLGLFFGVHPVEARGRRFPVVLYERTGFGAVTGLGDWSGGAFDGTIRVPIEDLKREEAGLRDILRHELAHAFVAEVGGARVPGWLNEGLAQWLESGRAEAVAQARKTLAGNALFKLEELEGSLAAWSDPAAIRRAYGQSLVLVDRLAREHGERIVVELIAGYRSGRSARDTFRAQARLELETLLTDL